MTPQTFEATEVSKTNTRWRGSLDTDSLELTSDGGPSQHLSRTDFKDRATLVRNLVLGRALILKTSPRLVIKLSPDAYDMICEWVGPPEAERIKRALNKQFFVILAFALMLIITALPGRTGPDVFDLDAGRALIGAAFLALAVLIKLRPHRVLFLAIAIAFLLVAGDLAFKIMNGWSRLWFLVLFGELLLSFGALGQYFTVASGRKREGQ